jgi:HEAT repeats/PilZ domain
MLRTANDLRSLSVPRRRAAVQALGALGASVPPSALSGLLPLLHDSDAQVRHAAAELVGCVAGGGGPAVHSILVTLYRMLVNPEPDVRVCAAQTLARIGPNARLLIPALTAALRDREVVVARLAAEALVRIGLEAAPALERLLDDLDASVRREARYAYNKLHGRTVKENTGDTAVKPLTPLTGFVPQRRHVPARLSRSERRRESRHPCRREAFYRFLGDLSQELWWKAEIRDVSPAGLGLILTRPAATGTRLTIDLREAGLARNAVARVARCCPIAGGWFAGCSLGRPFSSEEVDCLRKQSP